MRVLIVDDELAVRMYLEHVLRDLDFVTVLQAASAEEARASLTGGEVDVVLIDLKLRGSEKDGLELLAEVRRSYSATPIVVSGSQDLSAVRDALKQGAHDYIMKDEIADRVIPALRNLHRQQQLEREVRMLRARRDVPIPSLVGTSEVMQKLRSDLARVAASDRPALVRGQTGCGKELVANAIHLLSERAAEPFLALNCGALPASVIEAELFGYARGAFTGAVRSHDGFFTAVGRGTLFLDEVGELPFDLQAKLLRVLDAGTFTRVGSSKPEQCTGRIVAATNAPLEERVQLGTFRSDLLYRLNVLALNLPSLEARRSDIPALVAHFVSLQRRRLEFSEEAIEVLCKRDWPGNVRELRNLIDRLAVLAPEDAIDAGTVLEFCDPASRTLDRVQALAQFMDFLLIKSGDKLAAAEQMLIEEALRRTDNNKSSAARLLGVGRKVVERRLVDVGGSGASVM